jgi:hypothetical protein
VEGAAQVELKQLEVQFKVVILEFLVEEDLVLHQILHALTAIVL